MKDDWEAWLVFGVALVFLFLYRFNRKPSVQRDTDRTTSVVGDDEEDGFWSKQWEKVIANWEKTTTKGGKKEEKAHLLTYSVIFLFFYNALGLIIFRTWKQYLWEPWGANVWLFFVVVPGVMLVTAWTFTLRRKLLTFLALIVLIFLGDVVVKKYAESTWGKELAQKIATKSKVRASGKARLPQTYNDEIPPRNRTVIARPGMKEGEWPEDALVMIPPGYRCTYQEEGPVLVRPNKDESKVFRDEPLDDARELGRGWSFEFKSAGDQEVIVHLTFFRL